MYIVGRPIICDVLFCFILEVPVTNRAAHSSCTAAVSAQQPEEHVKNTLQNITTEWTPHSVQQEAQKVNDLDHQDCTRVVP